MLRPETFYLGDLASTRVTTGSGRATARPLSANRSLTDLSEIWRRPAPPARKFSEYRGLKYTSDADFNYAAGEEADESEESEESEDLHPSELPGSAPLERVSIYYGKA